MAPWWQRGVRGGRSVTRPDKSGEIWPNLFIVGAPKAGTTSLHTYLARHPEAFMCDPKEPHYFSSVTALPAWRGQAGAVTDPNTGRLVAPTVTAESAYTSLFAGAGGCRVIGESSTSYLADPEACHRIRETVPDARIIIMIRDPVERAVSHHLMYVREGWETRSLEQAIDEELREGAPWAYAYLRNGRYHGDIKRYLDAFGDRVLVIVLEDFVCDVAEGMAPVWEFLGLPPVDIGEARAVNAHTVPRNRVVATAMRHDLAWTVGRRLLPRRIRHRVRDATLAPAEKPAVAGELRRRLVDYYGEDVAATEQLLGQSLPWYVQRTQTL
jgi:hypothetical protein